MKPPVLACAVLLTTALATAQQRIELSPDGLDTARVNLETGIGSATVLSDSVPFGNTPDWICNLRMQVGGVALGDLDNDGDSDLVVGCYRSQSFPPYPDWRNFALYNLGEQLQTTPGWWTRDSISTTEVRIADFNNDGHPDVYSGNGDGSFPPDGIYFGTDADTLRSLPGWQASNATWTTGVALCDFDRDGDIDVATSNQGVSPNAYRPVSIFVNHNGSLEQSPSWTSLASEISSALAWGDINSDGFADLAVSKWVNFQSCVYLNDSGTVGRAPFWTANTTQGQKGIAWGDLNGDTLPDIAIGGSIPTQAYLNTGGNFGTSPVWSSQNPYHGTQDLAWGDVDGDGDPDLATAEFSTGQFRIYLNRGGQLDQTPSWSYDSPNVGTALTFGDINGDGRLDLVIGVSGQPCVSVFYNTLTTDVRDTPLPRAVHLDQNYPNPFNGGTVFSFTLDERQAVRLEVFDLLGRLISTVAEGTYFAGDHRIAWEASSRDGRPLPSGTYFYKMTTAERMMTGKMTYLR